MSVTAGLDPETLAHLQRLVAAAPPPPPEAVALFAGSIFSGLPVGGSTTQTFDAA